MKDIIDSILIGSFASFLPFWIWNSEGNQITGAIALIGVTYVFKRWHTWKRMGE